MAGNAPPPPRRSHWQADAHGDSSVFRDWAAVLIRSPVHLPPRCLYPQAVAHTYLDRAAHWPVLSVSPSCVLSRQTSVSVAPPPDTAVHSVLGCFLPHWPTALQSPQAACCPLATSIRLGIKRQESTGVAPSDIIGAMSLRCHQQETPASV